MERLYAYALSAAVILATAYPAVLDPNDDSFPLSTYPMFSRPKSRQVSVTAAIAVWPDGRERAVPPSYVANSEAMQALQTLRKSVQAGRKSAHTLCTRIASRIAAADDTAFDGAVRVQLVTSQLDSIRFLDGDTAPDSRRSHARCPIAPGVP